MQVFMPLWAAEADEAPGELVVPKGMKGCGNFSHPIPKGVHLLCGLGLDVGVQAHFIPRQIILSVAHTLSRFEREG
jgi:hypothetical protein